MLLVCGLSPAAAQQKADAPARPLVVIDAGHGGVDPGAKGLAGTKEKDVALAVARQVAAILREDRTLEVRMTRDRDTLIALRDRPRFANHWRGGSDTGQAPREALFISIHCNASEHRSAAGFETFFLSEAKTEDARRVADLENAAQRFEEKAAKLDPLNFILLDLRQNKYLRDSSDGAAMVQDRLAAVLPGRNRGVKQADFVVLNGAFMPAVLVELGFITNPAEEKQLTDAAFQQAVARELATAARDFLAEANAGVLAAGR